MIAGSDLLSTGTPLPYVAARSFVGSVAQIGGSFDLATRNVPLSGSGGTPATHAGTALISGNTLSICQDDAHEVTTVSSCAAGVLASYTLSTSGNNLFNALNNSTGTMFQFYVANSGAAKVLLSAGVSPDQSSQQFVIGLTDSQGGLAFGTVRGGSTGVGSTVQPDWVSIVLANSSPSATYSAFSALSSPPATGTTNDPLVPLTKAGSVIGGPFSIYKGPSVQNAAQIYVMQSTPLAVVFGSYSFGGGAASGLLEIALP
jgi:hypothetical protein